MRDDGVAVRRASSLDRERMVVSTIGVMLVLLWLGFAVHRSPRFAGSLTGTMLAVAGAALMTLPSVAYLLIKRIGPLTRWVTLRVRLQTLLAWHVYGGVLGATLAIAHTGHRFDSTLGIALTAAMLLAVLSGYVGRHFARYVALELRDKQQLLEELMSAYNAAASEMVSQPLRMAMTAVTSRGWLGLRRRLTATTGSDDDTVLQRAYRLTEIATSIADLEYSIKAHEMLKRRFRMWLTAHIITSIVFYALLCLHIWAAFYFGLRWLVR